MFKPHRPPMRMLKAFVVMALLAIHANANLNLGETGYGSPMKLKASGGFLYSAIFTYQLDPLHSNLPAIGIQVTKSSPALAKTGSLFIQTEREEFDIALADNGDIFVTGSYFDSVVIAGKVFGKDTSGFGFPDFFVARVSLTGEVRWLHFGECNASVKAIHLRSGSLYVMGDARRQFEFKGQKSDVTAENAFVLKLDQAGNEEHRFFVGGPGNFTADDFDMDAQGHFYFGGQYSDAHFIPDVTLDYKKQGDFIALKTDGQGKILGHWAIGADYADNAYSVRADPAGNAYFTGRVLGKASNGSVTLEGASGNFFLLKFDPAFKLEWAVKSFGNGVAEGQQIFLQSPGEILVAGSFAGTLNFGTGALSAGDYLNCYDIRDAFLMGLDNQGKVKSVERFGGGYEDFGYGVATLGRDIYVLNALDFGKVQESGPLAHLTKAKLLATSDPNSIRYQPQTRPRYLNRFALRIDGRVISGNQLNQNR